MKPWKPMLAYLLSFLVFFLLDRFLFSHPILQVLAMAALVLLCARVLGFLLGRIKPKESKAKTLISWVGLKGAGPILFAMYPVVAGIEGSADLFNIVFCISLLSLLLQGMSLTPVAKRLNLSYEEDPEVETFGMEIPEEMGMLRDHVVSEADLEGGATLRDMHLPHGIRVMMVRRGDKFLVPHGSMPLLPDDHLLIMMGESDD